jgi:hypothetical protein
MSSIRCLTPTLGVLVALGLFAPPSVASPAPRESATTQAAKRTPPPRKEVKLSPEVRARLSAATVTRKPMRFESLTSREVRENISADKRPMRANGKGKFKRVSNADLTDELNALERRLNSQGYSLRDNRTVVYREHRPDRAKLEQQVQRIREVADTKPERAPMTSEQLRATVRDSAKPPARRPLGLGTANNGLWVSQSPELRTDVNFKWTPSTGEPELASAFLDTRANFSASIGGLDPGLHGNVTVQAGAYVLGQRVDVARLESVMNAALDGTYEVDVTATMLGGFEYELYREKKTEPFFVDEPLLARDLPGYEQSFATPLFILGFPVEIEVTASPSIEVGYDVLLGEGYVVGGLQSKLTLEASLEVFVDAFLAEAGVGGSAVLVSASPDLRGAAYYGENNGKLTVTANVNGWMRFRLLDGRLYMFLDVGFCPLCLSFEYELWNYEGWGYAFPLFKQKYASER